MTPSTRNIRRTPEEEENFQNDHEQTDEVSDQQSIQEEEVDIESNAGSFLMDGEAEMAEEVDNFDAASTATATPSPQRRQPRDAHSEILLQLIQSMQQDREENRQDRREQAEERLTLKSTPQATREETFELKGSGNTPKPPFDGLDASKLRTFLAQCTLAFDGSPLKFKTDHNKVTYACSYLTGIAFSWYQTQASKRTPPAWRSDWDLFQSKLQNRYGEANIAFAADKAIKLLKMTNNSRLSEYESKFSILVEDLSWSDSDAALRDQFRSGLCYRIRDKLADIRPAPATLEEYIDTCFLIDSTYWENHDERSANASTHRQSAPFVRAAFVPRQNQQSSSSSYSTHRSSTTPDRERKPFIKSPTPSIKPLNLDASGKLNATDRQHRIDNNLCLYCGLGGHAVDVCPKNKRTNLRMATVNPTFTIGGDQQSKK